MRTRGKLASSSPASSTAAPCSSPDRAVECSQCMAQPQPPPPRPPPRIPEHIVDPPTLRLALASLFVLVQAYKLADALWPHQAPPPPLAPDDALVPVNWQLVKWLFADAGTVALVSFLRVPRLEWGWQARWAIRLVLWASDWLLFGRWTVRSPLSSSPSSSPRSSSTDSTDSTDSTL